MREDREDDNVNVPALAMSLQRVHGIVTLGFDADSPHPEILDQFEVTDNWTNLAATIASVYLGSTRGAVSYSYKEVAQLCRRAYHRVDSVEGDADGLPPFNSLPVREQLAWECVGRHAAWMVQVDEDEREFSGATELTWGRKVHEYARSRDLTLEDPAVY